MTENQRDERLARDRALVLRFELWERAINLTAWVVGLVLGIFMLRFPLSVIREIVEASGSAGLGLAVLSIVAVFTTLVSLVFARRERVMAKSLRLQESRVASLDAALQDMRQRLVLNHVAAQALPDLPVVIFLDTHDDAKTDAAVESVRRLALHLGYEELADTGGR